MIFQIRLSEGRMSSCFYVPRNEIDIDKWKEKLTVDALFGDEEKEVKLYKLGKRWFGFPRHFFDRPQDLVNKYVNKTIEGTAIEVEFTGKLWESQRQVRKEFLHARANHKKGFILVAKPGFGKTVNVINFITIIGTTALVVIPKSDLVKQWRNRFLEFTSLRDEDIGFVVGRKALWEGKKVVIALVHSLAIGYLPKEFRSYFGQVWFDEAHASVPPETFAPVGLMFPAKYRGGATATPDRSDGLDVVYQHHIQDCVIVGEKANIMNPTVTFLNYSGSSGEIPSWATKASQKRGILISMLSKNKKRNDLLVKRIYKRYKQGHNIIVISDRTEQLVRLRRRFHIKHDVDISESAYYVRGLLKKGKRKRNYSQEEIDKAINCRILFATYGMLKMGTDIPKQSAMVYATPQSDPRQTGGRLTRKIKGKLKPVIDDLVDVYYNACRRWASKRRYYYENEGYTFRGPV